MRKEILGLLAFCWTGLEMAQGQTVPNGGFQEPAPIQYQGMRSSGFQYAPPNPAFYPNYNLRSYPQFAPNQMQVQPQYSPANGVPSSYPIPMNGSQNFRPYPQSYAPQGAPVIQDSNPKPDLSLPINLENAPSDENPELLHSPQPASEIKEDNPSSAIENFQPVEPAEPYLVGPIGTWKPLKGYKLYGSADYLFWFMKAQPIPGNLSLSVSQPSSVPQPPENGQSGGRFFLGTWLNDRQDLGVEAGYFFLGTRSASNSQTFPGSNLSNKPIFQGIDSESAQLSSSTKLWGAEANARYQIWRGICDESHRISGYLDFLGGFRYMDLSEGLTIDSSTKFSTAPVLLSNATLTTSDSFGTHNNYYAGQLGFDGGLNWGRFDVNMYTKIGLGENHETVVIGGSTQVSAPPVLGNFTVPGGFYAQPGNSGRFNHDQFAVLPEAGFNVGFKVSDHCRLAVGYTLVYLSNVVRPGDQIDTAAGGTRPPLYIFNAGARPQPMFTGFNESSFWAQGINLTVEISY